MKLPHRTECRCPDCLGVDDTPKVAPTGEVYTPIYSYFVIWNDGNGADGEWRLSIQEQGSSDSCFIQVKEWMTWLPTHS